MNLPKFSLTSADNASLPGRITRILVGFLKNRSYLLIPIWLQFAVAITFVIFITIFTLSIIFLNRQEKQLYEHTIKIGLVTLNYFSSNARIPLLENNILMLNTIIKNVSNIEGLLYAFIVDTKHNIRAHTDSRKIDSELERFEEVGEINQTGNAVYFKYTLPDGRKVVNLTTPITFNKVELGSVHVGVSLDFINDAIDNDRQIILFTTGYIVFFSLLIAILLGIHFSRPVSELANATKEIAKGNYRYKIETKRRDEIGRLARSFNQMSNELFEKSLMQDTFGKYVGGEVLKMIMNNPADPWLRGKRNQATIIFTDIRGFTRYSEENEPEVVVSTLNLYFETATRIILQHHGYVDKFIGDAVLGVFGVPAQHGNHVEHAVAAALSMQKEFLNLSKKGLKFYGNVGIGINTGLVVSGNIGSQTKMEYTVIGDCVNTASRLNGVAGPAEIIISKNVYEQVRDNFIIESLPLQKVKGKSEPLEIFKVLGVKGKMW